MLDIEAARAWVRQYLAKQLHLDAGDIDLDRSFGEFGLDSADAVIMAAEMEEHFGIELDPAILLQYETISEMLGASTKDAKHAGEEAP